MTALELVARLKEAGIRIRAADGELELDAPRGALTSELRSELATHKPALLRLLSWSRRSGQLANIPLQPVSREQCLPLSWSQQRLWFLDQLEPGSSAYNISWTVRLRGELQFAELQAALNRLVQRHEGLRTCFPARDGVPYQFINTSQAIDIKIEEFAGAGDEKIRAALGKRAARSFDLASGPLLRATLLRLSPPEHILLVVIHHIVADGASMRILFRELAALYDEELGASPANLAALPVQYADYAVWQRKWLDGDELQRQASYWVERLDGLPPLLELPYDRPRSAAMRYRGASVLRVLPENLASELRSLGRANGCTLFMVMLAAFYVLLLKYTGREDLVLGTPMGGRPRTDLEGLIGFFINTVVLRQNLGGDPGFESLLQAVRETALEAHAHQEIPFERLVEMLEPQRELSYSPVFQVMFDLQEEPRWRLPVRDLEVVPEVVFSSRTSSFDLTLSIRQAENGLDAMFEYDTDLFDADSVERLASHYQTLLEDIVANPSQTIGGLSLIEARERQEIVAAWAQGENDWPAAPGLAALFESRVSQQPEARALLSENIEYSYAELNRRANRLAHRLQQLGLEPEQGVLLVAGRKPETVMAMLAILKAGGCVVPLDPVYPAERLRFMAQDSGANIALVQPGADFRPAGSGIRNIPLTAELFTAAEYSADNPLTLIEPTQLAFILYTSGTTGHPKGVELHHRGLINYVHQLGLKTAVTSADRVLQFASLSFDISLEECFTALVHGAALVLRTEEMAASMQDFVSGCERYGITWLSLPTAWWHELCRCMGHEALLLPASIRSVVIGGERARIDAFRAWHKHAGSVRLFNTYGPTEASIAATWCELTHINPDSGGDLPIGSPVPNVSAWVLDDRQQILPVGVPGALYIGGVGVARAYRNQAELSAESFVEVHGLPGRLYRTGDRARYLSDGRLVFMGRQDTQLKIRGHRIEPSEIETQLTALVDVEQAVVVARGDDKEEGAQPAKLVAYIVGNADTAELRSQLQPVLPDYMLPAIFVSLTALPLTRNGKLDYQALPAPEAQQAKNGDSPSPRTETERMLAAIWSEILGVPEIGIRDDFFALGGHSLIATRVVARVRDRFGVQLSLRVMFQNPTVEGIAAVLDSETAVITDARINRRTGTDDLPLLSWAQQRLWFIDQLEPNSSAYNLPWAARLNGSLDIECLQRAVDGLVERHESLRTRFASGDGEPVQIIASHASVRIEHAQLPVELNDTGLQNYLIELANQPFNLGSGPLFRVHVLQKSATEYFLLLLMHHIVSDGWSMGVLFRDLAALYSGFVGRQSVRLPALPVQYADYANWQRNWLVGDELARQEVYWRTQLRDMPPLLQLPLDKPRPDVQSYRGAWVSRKFDRGLLEGVRQLAVREGCTVFMLLLATFKILLARHTGNEDIVIGTPIAGRRYTELEGLIGFFLNTLALRTDVSGNPAFADLLARLKRTTLAAYDHQDLPFEKLLEILQPVRSAAHAPVVQVMFNLHNAPSAGLALEGIEVEAFNLDRATAKFDLSAALVEGESGLQVGFEYNTDIFTRDTIEGLLTHFGELLHAVIAAPEARIGSYELSRAVVEPRPAQFRSDLLMADSSGSAGSIVACFADVVRQHGTAVAIQTESESWTYAELNARANAVAQRVHQSVNASRQPVALLLGHDANMVAGLLGVIKAGCPYVPLDADVPTARLDSLISEAGVSVVVSDAAHRNCLAGLASASITVIDVSGQPQSQVAAPEGQAGPDDLAYILFTSGSTGKPKGVMQSNRNVLQHIRAYTSALQLNSRDRISLLSHYGFDAAVMDIFGALLNGACLCPVDIRADPDLSRLPAKLFAARRGLGISVLHATPSVFRLIASQFTDRHATASVRLVVLGGEEALASDFDLFVKHFPTALFVNGLGPSESTLALQYFTDAESGLPGTAVPVGSAVTGTRVLLLNEDGSEAGIHGELVICSEHVALGYWRQPKLTAQRFSPDPEHPGVMRYRTGDTARRLPDGRFIFTGRVDQQLKLRGHRIEPGEIEAMLTRHSGVERCVVVLLQGEARPDSRLVAYFSGTAVAAELRTYLQQVLPVYMVPAAFMALDEVPLTPNGKVDRRALPAPNWEGEGATDRVAPRTDIEKKLATIWMGLLQADEIGIHDDFFALGGHSLLATRVVARIRDKLARLVSLREFFTAPTVAGLAELLAVADRVDADIQLIQRRQSGDLTQLSWGQQRLWFLDQLEPESAAYNLHWAAGLHGAIRMDALQQAVDVLLTRHESLRTSFGTHAGEPIQLIGTDVRVTVQFESLPGASGERVQKFLLKHVQQAFDLRTGPLLRVFLLQLSEGEHILLLTMHHIVSDGWSMGVLFHELAALYNAQMRGGESGLATLPVQYADYAVWQREWLTGAELKRQEAYWLEQLQDLPPVLELPLDHPRPPVQRYRGAWVSKTLSPVLLDKLRALAVSQNCTLFMVTLVAFYALLMRHTGREDLVVGTPVAGRRRSELESLIGYFLNTLVLRAKLDGNPTFASLLQQVQKTTLDAYDHQELPFEKLLQLLQPARSTAHAPLVQLMFNLHNEPSAGLELEGLQVEPFSIDRKTSKFDMSVSLVESTAGLHAGFEYNTDLFERETVAELLVHYEELLEGVAENPAALVASLQLSSKAAHTCELPQVCTPLPDSVLDASVSARFDEIVGLYPERIAVQTATRATSYRALQAIANAVARDVQAVINGEKQKVGVLLGHNEAMVAGLLGVLKAGCAYIPLDPAAPAARIRSILEAAAISVVVTDNEQRDLLHAAVNGSMAVIEVPRSAASGVPDPGDAATPDDLAYVLFTSGSTGAPKGVLQTQRNLLHHIRSYSNALQINEQDRLSLFASYCFDAAVMDIFAAVLNGACLCPLEIKREEYPGQLLDQMGLKETDTVAEQGLGVTVLHSTPTVFRYLMRHKVCRHNLAGVRAVVLGGEEALAKDFALFKKHFAPPSVFVNGLGPSESTLATQFFADHKTRLPGGVVPVGKPVVETEIVLLDESGRPGGISGELAIRSRYVSVGYLNRDALSAEKFVQDPDESDVRLYRTGDSARVLPDGQFVYLGRLDAQMKVRGHRVEPGEIEATLAQLEGVERSAVVLRAGPAINGVGSDPRLIAFVVGSASEADMRRYLKSALPAYMLPAAFEVLEELPLTPNGKLDRAALPEPEWERSTDILYVAPRTTTEKQLAGIWSDVLGIAEVGVHDDFFELGGHSLLAAQLVARVTESLQVGLPLRKLFDAPTIADIAEHVETLQWALQGSRR